MTVARYVTAQSADATYQILINNVLFSDAKLLRVRQASGGSVPSSATFEFEPLYRGTARLQDIDLAALVDNTNRVTVRRRSKGSTTWKYLHWGRTVSARFTMNAGQEIIEFESRLDKHLMSKILLQPECMNHDGNSWVVPIYIDVDFRFNPVIDGKAVPNMHRDNGNADFDFFVPPEVMPPEYLKTAGNFDVDPSLGYWTIRSMAKFLCDQVNGQNALKELYVRNPTTTDLQVLPNDPDQIRDFRIPIGLHLADMLDILLRDWGYGWWCNPDFADKPRIQFFDRTASTGFPLNMQRYGEILDTDQSEVSEFDMKIDIVDRATNKPVVYGDYSEFESTFELVPGWDPALDDTPLQDLLPGSPAMLANPALRLVWRQWVLNESGDYRVWANDPNRVPWQAAMASPYDFDSIFTFDYVNARRRFLPMVTVGKDNGMPIGSNAGVLIEFNDGDRWRDVALDSITASVLENECGIRFNATNIRQIYRLKELQYGVRVTATVQSDWRWANAIATTQPTWLFDDKEHFADRGRAYKFIGVASASQFKNDANYDTREQDPTDEINAFGDSIYDAWNQATLSGQITLEGIDSNIQYMGQPVVGFGARDVGFDIKAGAQPGYPIAINVDYDFQLQKTVLQIESYRRTIIG